MHLDTRNGSPSRGSPALAFGEEKNIFLVEHADTVEVIRENKSNWLPGLSRQYGRTVDIKEICAIVRTNAQIAEERRK